MKAITVWQPWASLIALGAKPYEFRGWPAPRALIGQRIAIHAGARKVQRAEVRALVIRLRGSKPWDSALLADEALPLLDALLLNPGRAPLSSVVATAVLFECRRANDIAREFGAPQNDSARDEHFNWAWRLADAQPLEPVAPARGAQGFWDWRGERSAAGEGVGSTFAAQLCRRFGLDPDEQVKR